MELKVTPCDECGAKPVCKLTHSLYKVINVLSSFEGFFEGREVHLSFKCSHYIPKAAEVGK